jgi:spore coat polysaccharide biosynthesis protein SpsF
MKSKAAKVVAIVEARMTSKRLPGKHLLEVGGEPIIGHLISRLQHIRQLDSIVIAMTDRYEDDILEQYVLSRGINVFRGSEQDVMDRVLNAANKNGADVICEITGDCPIIDIELVEHAIKTYLVNNAAYVNNCRYGLPIGMGCQVFSRNALEKSASLTSNIYDREHVTAHIIKNPNLFSSIYVVPSKDLVFPDIEVTLDEMADYLFLKKIIEYFLDKNPLFSCKELVRYLMENPEYLNINQNVKRKF